MSCPIWCRVFTVLSKEGSRDDNTLEFLDEPKCKHNCLPKIPRAKMQKRHGEAEAGAACSHADAQSRQLTTHLVREDFRPARWLSRKAVHGDLSLISRIHVIAKTEPTLQSHPLSVTHARWLVSSPHHPHTTIFKSENKVTGFVVTCYSILGMLAYSIEIVTSMILTAFLICCCSQMS